MSDSIRDALARAMEAVRNDHGRVLPVVGAPAGEAWCWRCSDMHQLIGWVGGVTVMPCPQMRHGDWSIEAHESPPPLGGWWASFRMPGHDEPGGPL